MELIKCEAVLAAADTGSITGAAEQLDYTQSGITRMLNSLEDELGFSLFSRGKKGVTLTPNGAAMLPQFRSIVLAHRSAEQLSADICGITKGTITIGSYFSIAAVVLPQVIKGFTEMYPGVSVKVQEGRNLALSRFLSERSVDFCICARPSIEDYDWIPLLKDEVVVWLPANHPFAHEAYFPIRQLENEHFIHMSPNNDTDQDRFIKEHKLHMNTCFSTKDGFTTYNMVEAGLGISFNQRLVSKKWHGQVVEIPFTPSSYVEVGIAIPSLKQASPAAKKFINYLKQSLGEK